ncbi:T6SS immunity protein Tli4 family protein [Pseudomonas sp. GOM6]|uniref:T6SS immunity protein Tli4 family protein n=1 Tax=Pseudomonas sp. GOM6 TaxID=3036944 RepID=UPI0024094E39|nr:T6SS immunity protein Tli4 family protein [Pseudomonas sp. GOM6]MDG1583354.1 T6SS immunity protein Tli4 family protein [Pseudomonas sp. GOM6]
MIRTSMLAYSLLLVAGASWADSTRQECLGRWTFQVAEDIEWATFPADAVTKLSRAGGGGHAFSDKVSGRGEAGSYIYGSGDALLYVSDITTREEFDMAANYVRGSGRLAQKHLREQIDTDKGLVQSLIEQGYSPDSEAVRRVEADIEEAEKDIPLAHVYDLDLGIPDAHILGSEHIPFDAFLWRNQRVYYFALSPKSENAMQEVKDLLSRFRTRELYEVPKEPGVCFPYGFIADDGKASHHFKFSFRFTRTPNVIFSLLTVSPDNVNKIVPTTGTYDTDYRPGYDASKWKISPIVESLYFGKRLAGLEGWQLNPKPDSGEQERAWFAIAHRGGLIDPLLAVQIFTFKKGTDDLTDFTPPPETVIPRLQKLTKTMRMTLGATTQ